MFTWTPCKWAKLFFVLLWWGTTRGFIMWLFKLLFWAGVFGVAGLLAILAIDLFWHIFVIGGLPWN